VAPTAQERASHAGRCNAFLVNIGWADDGDTVGLSPIILLQNR